MPRPALARTTFIAASLASVSLLETVARAGYVPIPAGEQRDAMEDASGHMPAFDQALFKIDDAVEPSRAKDPERVPHDPVFRRPIPIPLPGAAWTGIIGLGAVAWAKRRVQASGQKAEGRIRRRS